MILIIGSDQNRYNICTSQMKNFFIGLLHNIKVAFLYVLGRIKVYRWPMFIVYDPKGYDVKAVGIRTALSLVRKGDILVRRYKNYLDGYFIPGRFTHSGVYVGDGVIIHAMSDGVQKIDILDFLRCDGFAILRVKEKVGRDIREIRAKAIDIAHSYLGNEYDYDFEIEERRKEGKPTEKVYCHELTRKCFPDLDIPLVKPSLWNGMIRMRNEKVLAQSFFESKDFDVIYDSDYSEPRCSMK